MKISFNLQQLGQNPNIWLRRAAYVFIPERFGQAESFARRLSSDPYPRFHIYVNITTDSLNQKIVNFDLHLDQKKPGYSGYKRHNAEYDGELVEREKQRLQALVRSKV